MDPCLHEGPMDLALPVRPSVLFLINGFQVLAQNVHFGLLFTPRHIYMRLRRLNHILFDMICEVSPEGVILIAGNAGNAGNAGTLALSIKSMFL